MALKGYFTITNILGNMAFLTEQENTQARKSQVVSDEVRRHFQWMANTFENVQGVIEKVVSEGKITLS